MQTSTAILFFSRSAEAEASQKNILAGQRNNLALIKRMISRTKGLMQRSGLDHFSITENEQVGDSFGERLSTAVQSVFLRGYERIIILGNDCPQLRLAHIRKAEKELEKGRNVLGRDQRGGAYLIGLRRNGFNADSFRELPWQECTLQDELTSYLAAEKDTALYSGLATLRSTSLTVPNLIELRVLADLTTWADLRRIWRFLLKDHSFANLLQFVTCVQFVDSESIVIDKLNRYFKICSRRGPPVLG